MSWVPESGRRNSRAPFFDRGHPATAGGCDDRGRRPRICGFFAIGERRLSRTPRAGARIAGRPWFFFFFLIHVDVVSPEGREHGAVVSGLTLLLIVPDNMVEARIIASAFYAAFTGPWRKRSTSYRKRPLGRLARAPPPVLGRSLGLSGHADRGREPWSTIPTAAVYRIFCRARGGPARRVARAYFKGEIPRGPAEKGKLTPGPPRFNLGDGALRCRRAGISEAFRTKRGGESKPWSAL